MVAYTYLIGWSLLDRWYYGVRYAKDCRPSDLWTEYFTSSDLVKDFREKNGEPQVVEVRRTFQSVKESQEWENKVLRRMKAPKKQTLDQRSKWR